VQQPWPRALASNAGRQRHPLGRPLDILAARNGGTAEIGPHLVEQFFGSSRFLVGNFSAQKRL